MVFHMKLIPRLAIMAMALLLSSCASVKSTEIFYSPATTVFHAPKESHAIIPILNAPPPRPYEEIGRFAFQTDLGYPFVQRALLYNARQSGADAVIIKNYQSWWVPSWYTVPPVYGWLPVGGWYGGGCGGGWYAGGAIPYAYPGYTGVTYQNFTGIDARMIIFK